MNFALDREARRPPPRSSEFVGDVDHLREVGVAGDLVGQGGQFPGRSLGLEDLVELVVRVGTGLTGEDDLDAGGLGNLPPEGGGGLVFLLGDAREGGGKGDGGVDDVSVDLHGPSISFRGRSLHWVRR